MNVTPRITSFLYGPSPSPDCRGGAGIAFDFSDFSAAGAVVASAAQPQLTKSYRCTKYEPSHESLPIQNL